MTDKKKQATKPTHPPLRITLDDAVSKEYHAIRKTIGVSDHEFRGLVTAKVNTLLTGTLAALLMESIQGKLDAYKG